MMVPARLKTAWEERCHRCGRCCFEKIEFEGEVYYSDEPCQFLDLETRLCRVYEQRHRHRHDCLPIDDRVISSGWLPRGCGYVACLPDYNGPKAWEDGEE